MQDTKQYDTYQRLQTPINHRHRYCAIAWAEEDKAIRFVYYIVASLPRCMTSTFIIIIVQDSARKATIYIDTRKQQQQQQQQKQESFVGSAPATYTLAKRNLHDWPLKAFPMAAIFYANYN